MYLCCSISLYQWFCLLADRIAGLDGKTRDIPPFILARAFLGMFFSYYITEILMGPDYAA